MIAEPPIAQRARALAESAGFRRSSIPEVGRLLHVLAGERGRERVAEVGTGYGVGSAWILSALEPSVPFFTVENDRERAATARELLAADVNARVLEGDWREMLPPHAPFDLLFLDGGYWKRDPFRDGETGVGLLAPRGLLVIDDMTPGRRGPDPVREWLFGHETVVATEILTTPSSAALLAVRAR